MRKLIGLLFLLITSYPIVGQTPPYIHFRGGEDIPSSETYHVIQDRQGYIWIATANGVSRFDGYEFRNFGEKDGLPDNVILEIYEDYKGRIWFVSYSGLLSYYYRGKIFPYKYNYLMPKIFAGGRGAVKLSFCVSKYDEVLVSVIHKGAFKISSNGTIVKLYSSIPNQFIIDFSYKLGNAFITYDTSKVKYGWRLILADKQNVNSSLQPVFFSSHFFAVQNKKDEALLTFDCSLISYQSGVIHVDSVSKPIIWTSVDREGHVWISKYGGGVACYRNFDISKPPLIKLFNGLSITSVVEDHEGGYWLSTYANGIFYVSSIQNKTYFWNPGQMGKGQIQAFCATPNGIWVGFDRGKLSMISRESVPKEINTSFLYQYDISINGLVCDERHQRLWLLSNVFLYSEQDGKFVRHTDNKTYRGNPQGFSAKCLAIDGDRLWLGTRLGVILYDGHHVVYNSRDSGDFSGSVSSIVVARDGIKWLGCSNGLWKYENGKFDWLGLSIPILRSRISELAFNPIDGSLWIATHGEGLVIFNKKVIAIINQSSGLASNVVTSIAMGPDRVWVGTSAGINQISIIPDISGQYTVGAFDRSVGIVSNEIVGLQATDSTLIIGTREGLLVYPYEKFDQQVRPKVYITKFEVNGKDTTTTNNASYSYLQNHIAISFSGLTFKTLRKTLFRYKLHKDDPEFSYTRFPSVTLPALSPNSYNFEVWAQNAYGQWSEEPATIDFVINSPFWDTPWFIFLVSTLIIAIISTLFAYRFRSLKRQTALSRRLDGWKQQALLQQMNPHFIFNTLNSIQLFILQNDTLSSHRYLTKFAKLMRLTLDNSQNFSVRLSEELETINLYLELEALRADGKFTFEIQQPEDLLLEARIPSLIIQPFIENAIWHGVMPKTSPGIITIQFRQKANSILCTIEDNGIGRKAAESYAATRVHKSLGSKITMQRLQLLKSLHNQQLGILYKDLMDKDGNPSGTRVELTIPILSSKIQLD